MAKTNELKKELKKIGWGIGIVLGMHVAAGLIAFMLAVIFPSLAAPVLYGFLAIGLAQIIYVIPAIALLYWRKQWGLMRGVIVGAVITALLNVGGYLLVFRK